MNPDAIVLLREILAELEKLRHLSVRQEWLMRFAVVSLAALAGFNLATEAL